MTVQWECIAFLLQGWGGGGDPEKKMFKLRPKEWVEVCWLKVMSGSYTPSQTEEAPWLRSIAVPSFNPYWITRDQWFFSLFSGVQPQHVVYSCCLANVLHAHDHPCVDGRIVPCTRKPSCEGTWELESIQCSVFPASHPGRSLHPFWGGSMI